MTDCKVVVVTKTPAKFISMIGGVLSSKRAEAWGEKGGFVLVHWHKRLQRVYGIVKVEKKKNVIILSDTYVEIDRDLLASALEKVGEELGDSLMKQRAYGITKEAKP